MVSAKVTNSGRLLTISFALHVTEEEVKAHRRRISELLGELQPGFVVLTDLSGLESMDSACAPEIAAVMDMLAAKNVGSIARVIPDPQKDIGFNVLAAFHYDRGVQTTTHENLADALQTVSQETS